MFWVGLSWMTLRLVLELLPGPDADRVLLHEWRAWVIVPLLLIPYAVVLGAAATWAAAVLVSVVRRVRPLDGVR